MDEKKIKELERESIARSRYVGMAVTPEFYETVKRAAQDKNISASRFLRQAIVEKITRSKR